MKKQLIKLGLGDDHINREEMGCRDSTTKSHLHFLVTLLLFRCPFPFFSASRTLKSICVRTNRFIAFPCMVAICILVCVIKGPATNKNALDRYPNVRISSPC